MAPPSDGCKSMIKRQAIAITGLVAILLLLSLASVVAQPFSASLDSAVRSPRNASYVIEVHLDPETKMLEGRQVVTWRNIQEVATDELWFHLYWNGWRNDRSTWMLEDRHRGRSSRGEEIDLSDWGWIEVDSISLVGAPDGSAMEIGHTARFVAPDDANPDDRTVLLVDLPRPVEPGGTVEVELEWRARIPRTFARTGYRGDFFFIAHWFPKLGVFEPDGWNCYQYHASTEYFSDYGVYDVRITVPEGFVLGATGRQVERTANSDGSVTYRHVQEDVHAFTWTTSPDYLVVTDRFEAANLPPVDLRLLIQPEHQQQAERHLHATKAALDRYGTWYGPYPYGHVTVVDPAWGSGAGGMEYPTLFTAGTRLFNPLGGGSPEGVTVHEAGHQFWYGLVGNNEFEDAWLDEGLNTFSASRTKFETYGAPRFMRRFFSPPGTQMRGFFPILLDGFAYDRSIYENRVGRYRAVAEIDRQDTASYLYFPTAGSGLSYSKTTLWLGTLERLLGWERLQPAMSEFFRRWQFGHPQPGDFFAALEEFTGEDLGWFFDQVYRSSEHFDYAIDSVTSRPARLEGFSESTEGLDYAAPVEVEEDEDDEDSTTVYRSEVVVRRQGGSVFPVEILLVFEDGEELRYPWDGRDRWRLIVEERPGKLQYAAVDPDEILLLDIDRTNNTRLREPEAQYPALKWSSRWLVWFQDFISMVASLG